MSKRKYTHIEALLPEIKQMLASGQSQREIEQLLGLEGDCPIHNLLKRERRKAEKVSAGIVPRPKGRPRKDFERVDTAAEQAHEINRLKMENKLLRDFLRSIGRR